MNNRTVLIRRWLLFFIVSLFVSGLTAIPVESGLHFLTGIIDQGAVGLWLKKVYFAIRDTNTRYPFIAYGYDWLAFAHFLLAILFIGPYQ